jgi:hypothetical protein
MIVNSQVMGIVDRDLELISQLCGDMSVTQRLQTVSKLLELLVGLTQINKGKGLFYNSTGYPKGYIFQVN